MKTLTKISLVAATLAASVSFAYAGPRHHAAADRHALRAHALKRLDLTAEQRSALKDRRAALKETLHGLRADGSLTKEQRKEKAREALTAARSAFRDTLTAEQKAKLETMRERAKHRRGRG